MGKRIPLWQLHIPAGYVGRPTIDTSFRLEQLDTVTVVQQRFGDRTLFAALASEYRTPPSPESVAELFRRLEVGYGTAMGDLPPHPKLTWEF